MHQNRWIAAIAELEADGLETTPCPSTFPPDLEHQAVSIQFWNCSEGARSDWAAGLAGLPRMAGESSSILKCRHHWSPSRPWRGGPSSLRHREEADGGGCASSVVGHATTSKGAAYRALFPTG